MSKMESAPLSLICEVNPRFSKEQRPVPDAKVTFVPMAAVDETLGEITTPQVRRYSEVSKGFTAFREADVLFAKITPCMENGKAAIARNLRNGMGFGSTEFHVLRAGPTVLPEWIYFYIRQPDFRRRAKASFRGAAGQQRVPVDFLESEGIPLAPISEQRRIVDILCRANGIVQLQRQATDRAREIIPALFLEMFGDPTSNPKSWPLVEIGDLCKVDTGATPNRRNPDYYVGSIHWIKTKEILGGQISVAEETISERAIQDTNCKVFPINTVLVAMYGQGLTRGRVGVLGIPAATNQACAAILPSEKVITEYLFECLKIQYSTLRALARGGNQPNLNLSMIKRFPIPIPPVSRQRVFAKLQGDTNEIADQKTACAFRSKQLFQSLLNRAFSGAL